MNEADHRNPLHGRLVFSGHAKLPQEAAARGLYETLAIVVSVEARYGVVLQADSNFVTKPGRQFVHDLLIGVSLEDSQELVLGYVQSHYWGGAKRALLAALRDLYENWAHRSESGAVDPASG